MTNFTKKYKTELFFLLYLAFYTLTSFLSVTNNLDLGLSHYIYDLFSRDVPDPNIVIIDIDNSDTGSLHWPLNRSYYALLFNELEKYSPKVIGFEVFLSDKNASQEIYNEVLASKIRGRKNIVFSSLMKGFTQDGDYFNADTVEYPSIKKLVPDLATGHINYLTEEDLIIPHIFTTGKTEYPFASVVAEKFSGKLVRDVSIRPKMIADAEDFKRYSLIEFIKKSKNGEISANELENKIVLIGVSASRAGTTIWYKYIHTKGIYLHANAIDNILNDRTEPSPYMHNIVNLLFFIIFAFIILKMESRKAFVFGILTEVPVVIIVLLISNIQISLFTILMSLFFYQYVFIDGKLYSLQEWEKILKTRSNSGFREIGISTHKAENDKILPEQIHLPDITNLKKQEFEGIIYSGDLMAGIVEMVKKSAPESVPVLVLGESGSGKELVARALHNQSHRRHGNFVAVNCAALTETLLESELFGHVKGAFTGADKDKQGRFELANNGTIFLDEIGETSDKFQAKLLRVLQSGEYERVGSGEKLRTNARIVAATNKDLKKLIKLNKFREDLFYRLNVITITIPALRERKEDIPVLAKHFLESTHPETTMNEIFIRHLVSLDWPGNVRELEAAIRRAAIFAKFDNRDYLTIKDLPDEISVGEKDDLDEKVLALLREKKFSHTSIKETASELGDLNRNLVTENFKGVFFRAYVECEFDITKATRMIADINDDEVIAKVLSKGETYILNVEKEVRDSGVRNLDEAHDKFSAKYKNLPKQFHNYLDLIIKRVI